MIAMLRRRLMGGRGAFEFTYTGQFTDKIEGSNRVIKLISSGILQVSADADVSAYLLAGGGGAIAWGYWEEIDSWRDGGHGGSVTKFLNLNAHYPYDVIIGRGGKGHYEKGLGTDWQHTSGTGGKTQAFGLTCTGGTGAVKKGSTNDLKDYYGGSNGSPYNGATNGGQGSSINTIDGGDGYVTLTIPI